MFPTIKRTMTLNAFKSHTHTLPLWMPEFNLHPWHAVRTRAFIMTQQSDFLSLCWRQAVNLMRCQLALEVFRRQIGPPANLVQRGWTSPWQPCRRTVWATWPSLHNLTLSVSNQSLHRAKHRLITHGWSRLIRILINIVYLRSLDVAPRTLSNNIDVFTVLTKLHFPIF